MNAWDDESIADLAAGASRELADIVSRVPSGAVDEASSMIGDAHHIALYGVGREGLMLRALAMRLYHLGLDAHVVGEMTTPPVASDDLLIVSAGPGYFATVSALMDVARDAGACVLLFTSLSDAPLACAADYVVRLPAQTMAVSEGASDGVLPMGSAYEGAQFLFFEILVRALGDRLGSDEQAMRERHTNLE